MSDGNDLKQWWTRYGVLSLGSLAVVAVALLVYAGSVANEFVWDDPIVLGQQLQAFHSLHDIFFPPPRIPQFGHQYYRPLVVLSYVIDRWLWGDTPFGFHFPVVVFHAINSGLVFLLGYRLFGKVTNGLLAAFAGAVLFATHPIHTESVCWMAGRSDTLAALFLLPALLAYLAWKRRSGEGIGTFFLILSAVLFLGGCFAKESALGFIFIVAAVDLLGIRGEGGTELGLVDAAAPRAQGGSQASMLEGAPAGRGPSLAKGEAGSSSQQASSRRPSATSKKQGKTEKGDRSQSRASSPSSSPRSTGGRTLFGWAALGTAGAVYFGMRITALASERAPLTPQTDDPLKFLNAVVSAVGFYISKIFVPIHLDAYIPNIPSPGLALFLGAIGIPCAALLVLLAVVKGEKLIAFFMVWFFGALAPSLAIVLFIISEAPVAERYLYLPSIGFCLLVAYLAIVKAPSLLPVNIRRVAAYGAAAASLALAVVYGEGTIVRARVWKKDLDFWTDGVAKSPNEGLPHLHLGLAYANMGDKEPGNVERRLALERAEKEYRLAIDPSVEYDVEGRSTALNNLGMLYMSKGEFDQAEDFFEQAIKMRPDYPTPHYGIGVTSLRRAERLYDANNRAESGPYLEKSKQYLERAIELNPQYVKAHNQLAYLLANTGHVPEAMQHLDKVLSLVRRGPEYDFAVKIRNQLAGKSGGRAPAVGRSATK